LCVQCNKTSNKQYVCYVNEFISKLNREIQCGDTCEMSEIASVISLYIYNKGKKQKHYFISMNSSAKLSSLMWRIYKKNTCTESENAIEYNILNI
jgi:hypothetical protein